MPLESGDETWGSRLVFSRALSSALPLCAPHMAWPLATPPSNRMTHPEKKFLLLRIEQVSDGSEYPSHQC